MSSGAAEALSEPARRDIRAAALDSPAVSGTPGAGMPDVTGIKAPLLVLAETADDYVPFTFQKNLVDALQQRGKAVEWHYYQGRRHTLILDPAHKQDAMRRIIDFFNVHLRAGT